MISGDLRKTRFSTLNCHARPLGYLDVRIRSRECLVLRAHMPRDEFGRLYLLAVDHDVSQHRYVHIAYDVVYFLPDTAST